MSDLVPGVAELHLWLCRRDQFADSPAFRAAILSRYCALSPMAMEFAYGEHGKPSLASPGAQLEFNISHSGAWTVCALSAHTPVGVDVQRIDAARDTARLARRFFSRTEVADLEALRGPQARDRFYDYWTLKEAAVKARGEALAPGLARHAFRFSEAAGQPGRRRIVALAAAADDGAHYSLLEPAAGYRLALCWRGVTAPSRLRAFRDTGSGYDELTELPLHATSAQWPDSER